MVILLMAHRYEKVDDVHRQQKKQMTTLMAAVDLAQP
jgi:hypothetical protein